MDTNWKRLENKLNLLTSLQTSKDRNTKTLRNTRNKPNFERSKKLFDKQQNKCYYKRVAREHITYWKELVIMLNKKVAVTFKKFGNKIEGVVIDHTEDMRFILIENSDDTYNIDTLHPMIEVKEIKKAVKKTGDDIWTLENSFECEIAEDYEVNSLKDTKAEVMSFSKWANQDLTVQVEMFNFNEDNEIGFTLSIRVNCDEGKHEDYFTIEQTGDYKKAKRRAKAILNAVKKWNLKDICEDVIVPNSYKFIRSN
ncbi:hypothetical protein [Priestia megaterium]|uniref:hypothetical protein n=1 Tax=Priestia megaterium TaxID=1404 RepID=UPI000BFEA7A8|nr:hypothetical protein [Priestia megaterium]PGO60672.1 hypothetical protein CN981_08975 [Priestia megaterium]